LDGSKEIDLKEIAEWNDDLGVRFAQQVWTMAEKPLWKR
jgi:hydroxymethylbilane synthase